MWLARFLLDVIVCIGILAAIPKLLGTGIDLIGRISGSINAMVRKMFQLDNDKVDAELPTIIAKLNGEQ